MNPNTIEAVVDIVVYERGSNAQGVNKNGCIP